MSGVQGVRLEGLGFPVCRVRGSGDEFDGAFG